MATGCDRIGKPARSDGRSEATGLFGTDSEAKPISGQRPLSAAPTGRTHDRKQFGFKKSLHPPCKPRAVHTCFGPLRSLRNDSMNGAMQGITLPLSDV
jgi:hypothetical protein